MKNKNFNRNGTKLRFFVFCGVLVASPHVYAKPYHHVKPAVSDERLTSIPDDGYSQDEPSDSVSSSPAQSSIRIKPSAVDKDAAYAGGGMTIPTLPVVQEVDPASSPTVPSAVYPAVPVGSSPTSSSILAQKPSAQPAPSSAVPTAPEPHFSHTYTSPVKISTKISGDTPTLWRISAHESIHQLMQKWCDRVGWQLNWTPDYDYFTVAGADLQDTDFQNAVSIVIGSYEKASPPLKVDIYPDHRLISISNPSSSDVN